MTNKTDFEELQKAIDACKNNGMTVEEFLLGYNLEMPHPFNRPIVVKYFDQIMPVIISTCSICHVELFRSMTFEQKNISKSFCLECIRNIEMAAFKYNVIASSDPTHPQSTLSHHQEPHSSSDAHIEKQTAAKQSPEDI